MKLGDGKDGLLGVSSFNVFLSQKLWHGINWCWFRSLVGESPKETGNWPVALPYSVKEERYWSRSVEVIYLRHNLKSVTWLN